MFHQRAGWYKRDRLGAIVENTIFRVADTGGRTGTIVNGGKAYQSAEPASNPSNPKRQRRRDHVSSLTLRVVSAFKPAHKKSMVGTMRPCFKSKQDWSFFVADAKRNPPRHLPTSNCLSRTTIDRFAIGGSINKLRVSSKVFVSGKV